MFVFIFIDRSRQNWHEWKKNTRFKLSRYFQKHRRYEWMKLPAKSTKLNIQFNSIHQWKNKKKSNHRFTSPSPVHKRILDLYFRFFRISSILIRFLQIQILFAAFHSFSAPLESPKTVVKIYYFPTFPRLLPKIRIFQLSALISVSGIQDPFTHLIGWNFFTVGVYSFQ